MTNEKLECDECTYTHHEPESFCGNCGACLYENGKQDLEAVEETGLPFHICTKCGKSNFWD